MSTSDSRASANGRALSQTESAPVLQIMAGNVTDSHQTQDIGPTSESSTADDGLVLLVECCSFLFHTICGLLQGILGLVPLMVMWTFVCTLVAVMLLPFDAVMAFLIVIRKARDARFLTTISDALFIFVVLALWPFVVCTFHVMAALVLAFSEPFERQGDGSFSAVTTGGLRSMFRFAGDRTRDFLKLCCCRRIDFWHKWKMMLRAVTAFLVFFAHCAITLAVASVVAAVKLPVYAIIGLLSPCMWFAELMAPLNSYGPVACCLIWAVSLPLWFPLLLMVCILCCALFSAAYSIGAVFLLVMSLLGGGLYVADATFKKMNGRITRMAIVYVITEFDKDSSEIMASMLSGESHVGRLLPSIADPYPEFTVDDTTATLNCTATALDESCQQFLQACKIQGQDLLSRGWLEITDFQTAEPFIFMGVPGHVLIDGLQRSMYGQLKLEGASEVSLSESTVETCWVDPLKGEVADAQIMAFEACLSAEEWRYLKAWVVLSGDEERMKCTGVTAPSDPQRLAQLHRLASAANSMAISITRMAWFQAHFQEKVMDVLIGSAEGAASLKSIKCTTLRFGAGGVALPAMAEGSSDPPQETILTMPYEGDPLHSQELNDTSTELDNECLGSSSGSSPTLDIAVHGSKVAGWTPSSSALLNPERKSDLANTAGADAKRALMFTRSSLNSNFIGGQLPPEKDSGEPGDTGDRKSQQRQAESISDGNSIIVVIDSEARTTAAALPAGELPSTANQHPALSTSSDNLDLQSRAFEVQD